MNATVTTIRMAMVILMASSNWCIITEMRADPVNEERERATCNDVLENEIV
jgi:hypothetical protein